MSKPIDIEYGEDVVVVVKRNQHWSFYVGYKDIWIMDQHSWAKSYVDAGYEMSLTDFSDRFDIAVLDVNTADAFFEATKDLHYSIEEIRQAFEEQKNSGLDVSIYYPTLLIDFDAKCFTSYFPEVFPFNKHLPQGWTFKYEPILDAIPQEYKYWDEVN